MEIIHTLLLAVVQGIAEFLPISSSGHLVLVEKILGIKEPQSLLNTMLHAGTLLAVILYFFRDILNIFFDGLSACGEMLSGARAKDVLYRNPYLKLFLLVIAGTIPAGIAALFLHAKDEIAFGSLFLLSIGFIFTAIVIYFSRRNNFMDRGLNQLNLGDSLWIGFAQALAVLPGVSRSGMTIAMGLNRGLDRALAFRFSFILSIPATLGALLLEAKHLVKIPPGQLLIYSLGALISFLVGLAVIRTAEKIIVYGNFYLFSYYVGLLGIVTLVLSFWV